MSNKVTQEEVEVEEEVQEEVGVEEDEVVNVEEVEVVEEVKDVVVVEVVDEISKKSKYVTWIDLLIGQVALVKIFAKIKSV